MITKEIGDFCKVIGGYAFKSSDFTDEGIPVLKIKNIGDKKLLFEDIDYLPEKFLNIHDKYKVCYGDIMISMTGSHVTMPASAVGRVARSRCHETLLLNQRVGKMQIDENICSKSFLYYCMTSVEFKEQIGLLSRGAANQANVSGGDIESIKVRFPPLPTQKKIAGILSAYDDAIENNLRRIKLLEEMAQITYEEWFVRLRFPGYATTPINKANGLPEGWKYGSLGDLAEFQNGYAFKGGDFKNEGFPVIKIKNIGSNTVDINDTDFVDSEVANVASKFKLDEGDLLIAMTGATIGKTGFLPFSSKPCYLNQRVGKFLRKKDSNNIHYIFAAIGGDRGLQQVLGLASGAAQPNISGNQILSLKCTVPSKEILSKYSLFMQSNFDLILGFVRQNQRLREARDILLPRLMTGVIDAEKYQPENFLKKN